MARDLFPESEKKSIEQAIKDAEKMTSGEIQVHIERKCKGNPLDRASSLFAEFEMHKTKLRNGVLFYVAMDSKQFAILGDAGINSKTPDGFWDEIKLAVIEEFKTGGYSTGLIKGILMAGDALKTHFPYQKDDINELPDEISFGNN
ncbi:MAG: putative membrane protein [Sphingobacteriales bacterium]|jgi:uncharacterized membrane protein